jgi:hypothetical protein
MSTSLLERVAKAKAEAEDRLSRGGNNGPRANFWKPKNGPNHLRIMPAWTDSVEEFKNQFWREVAQHWRVSEDQKGPITCPKKTPGMDGDCPICEFVDELKQDKDNAKASQLISDIRAKTTYMYNVVDLQDAVYTAADTAEWTKARPDAECPFEVGSPKVQLYAAPLTLHDSILGIITTSRKDITRLADGRGIVLTKFPNKDPKLTRYQITPDLDAEEFDLGDTTLPQLHQQGQTMDYAEMTKVLKSGVGAAATSRALGSGKKAAALPATTKAAGSKSSGDDLEAELRSQLDK